jgi:hypothetical protein
MPRLLNELRLRRDIARLGNQVGKLGSSPAQIKNKLATLSDSELTWIGLTPLNTCLSDSDRQDVVRLVSVSAH